MPDEYQRRSRRAMAAHVRAMLAFQRAGAIVFDYGNNLRAQAQEAGVADAFDYPGFVPAFIRPQFCEGRGPFRWAALERRSGRHRPDGPGRPGAVPGRRRSPPLDRDGPGARPVPGPAGAHLLARLRRAPPGRASRSTSWSGPARSAPRSSSVAITWTPVRSPHPTARPRRCWTAPTPSPTGRC